MNSIFTVGYSPHSLETFIQVLKTNSINVVADVRSSPYSQFKAEFNREPFSDHLAKHDIRYIFFGDIWGARLTDRKCYVNGQVDFTLASKTDVFADGMSRIKKGISNYRIALMCAEKDPITCHRGIWLSRQLQNEEVEVLHILADGHLEQHGESEIRLLKEYKLNHPDLFMTEEQRIEKAYRLRAEKVAYNEEESPTDLEEFGI